MITQALKPQTGGRRFAIGDLHGRPDKLKAALKAIKFTSKDVAFLMGDYIDRGLDSKGVIDYIWHLQNKYRLQTLLGNHELMFILRRVKPRPEGRGYKRQM